MCRRSPWVPVWLSRALAGATCAVGLLAPLAAPGTVLAHERRAVGPYTFVVGWMTEPPLLGQPNGIDLRITRTEGDVPVEGADRTLKPLVAFGGGNPKEFALRAIFGRPGAYTSDIIPTRAGSFIFTFTGTLEGTQVNQRFESGPGRFNDVEATEKIQFPEAAPAATQLQAAVSRAEARASAAEAHVGQAQALGAAGAALGLLGIAAAGYAVVAARRTAPAR